MKTNLKYIRKTYGLTMWELAKHIVSMLDDIEI